MLIKNSTSGQYWRDCDNWMQEAGMLEEKEEGILGGIFCKEWPDNLFQLLLPTE